MSQGYRFMAGSARQAAMAAPPGRWRDRGSLYHYQTYANAGMTALAFFGSTSASATNLLEDTNLTVANSLPQGWNFYARSLQVVIFPGVSVQKNGLAENDAKSFADDVYTFYKRGYVEFIVGTRTYVQEGPLGRFPPKFRLGGYAALSDATTATGAQASRISYATASGETYELPNLLIPGGTTFSLNLKWAAVQALPSSQDARVGVIIDGEWDRPVQS